MAKEKILNQATLTYYDTKLKAWVTAKDEANLDASKKYADSLAENYDPAGTAQTKVDELKNKEVKDNTDAIAKLNGDSTVDGSVDKKIATAKTALETSIAGVEAKADQNADAIEALDKKVGTIPASAGVEDVIGYINKKTEGIASSGTVTALADRMTAAEESIDAIEADYLKAADKTELEAKIKQNADALGVLNGEGAGSVKKQIDDAFNDFSTKVTDDGVVNSYKELIDWAATHGSEAAEMAAGIQANKTSIDELKALVGTLPEDATADTVVGLIQEVIAAEKARAEGVESGLDTRLKAIEGQLGSGEGSVTEQIATAKKEAIDAATDAASADATTKANKALADAKTYTDTEVGKDRTRLDALEADTHTHANKTELDKFETGDKAKLDDAATKAHIHANKDVLDGITAIKVTNWDAAESNAKTYADGLNNTVTANVNAVADRTTALEALVGDGFEIITNSAIDAMFAEA